MDSIIILLLTVALAIGILVVYVWSVIDVIKSTLSTAAKVWWVLALIFLGLIPTIVWLFVYKSYRPRVEE